MPKLTKEDKERILEDLRSLYPGIYEGQLGKRYSTENGMAIISQMIRQDMEEIIKDGLLNNRMDWEVLCYQNMAKFQYTYDELAEIIGISRKLLYDQEHRANDFEKKLKKIKESNRSSYSRNYYNIDPFYLEAFSLIYKKSPYLLLGRDHEYEKMFQITRLDLYIYRYRDSIMKFWFVPNSKEHLEYLEVITGLGRLSASKYDLFFSILENIMPLNVIYEIDPLANTQISKLRELHVSKTLSEYEQHYELFLKSIDEDANMPTMCTQPGYNNWTRYYVKYKNSLKWTDNIKDSQDYQLRYIYWEALCVFEDLVHRNPKRLRTLAQIACAQPKDRDVIPADYFPYIAKYNNDRFMIITSARVEISEQWIPSIFSVVENRLLDLLLLLEKEFGNLDELDLDTSSKTQEELESVANQISIIIYNDNRVQVGDKNKIEGSKIASAIRENAGR